MQKIIDEFEERVAEVEQFVKVLERLENLEVRLYHRPTRRQVRVFEEESFKVMKATVFLLIYNVVESAIRSAFGHLYDQIVADAKHCADLRDELRRVWIGQRFRALDDYSASPRNYRELAETLAGEIISQTTVTMSKDRLPVSGNLDSESIRRVCRDHGVSVKVHYRALGGFELETVKQQRNALAHGSSSFSSCGQQYTTTDLKRIKRQAFVFVRSILRNLKRFVEKQQYAAQF